jgi:mRNA interferase RelE/StbE
MKVILSPTSKKQLKSVGRAVQIILAKKIREFVVSLTEEQKLTGYRNLYRIRVGNYRIVYRRTHEEVYIVLIGHRREIYRLLKALLR